METSKIVERTGYRAATEYHYRKCLPRNVWYTDYEGDKEVHTLRKPIKIEEVGVPNYEDNTWYDEFGNKSSNVDYQYDEHDYKFYRIAYETIYLDDEEGYPEYNYNEFEGTIESREEEEYIYVDEYKKLTSYELESDIDEIAREVKDSYSLDEEDNCYGDCYSDKIDDYKIKLQSLSNKDKLTCADYRDYLGYIREKLDEQVRAYIDSKEDE